MPPDGTWWPLDGGAAGLVEDWWLPPRFSLRRLVGRGSYGVCALVWCAETSQEYVVKRVLLLVPRKNTKLPASLAVWTVTALRRTLREIAILRRLQPLGHPHLVELLDAWTDCAPAKSKPLAEGGAGRSRRPIPALYLIF